MHLCEAYGRALAARGFFLHDKARPSRQPAQVVPADRGADQAHADGEQEESLGIRSPLAIAVDLLGDEVLDFPAHPLIAADLPVMHEERVLEAERMAILPAGRGAAGGPHMGEEEA